ncbi:hypothetical protein H6A11_00350 [Bifidobacterium pullorum subsp. saeculare]|uniref:hypothetical protein n=1 Tax=Bifidobacterium pullorum TaxID=78448 RepID=UPI001956A8A1|nr:hypothetical protein [Bifidobacterium pullorum]MBM6695505.1 hypothetical protein [Bifidobacterium pullorum subsp. saeculare]
MSDETRNEPETQVIPQTDDAVTQAMPVAETRELPETVAPTQAMPQAEPTQNGTADVPQPGQVPEPEPATMPQQVPLYSTAPPSQTAAGGAPTAPAYVQVPVEPRHERPVIRKTGLSAATIVLGVLLVLIGAMVLAFGIGFPMTALPGLGADPRAIVAIVCGIVGGVLIVVAIIWAVARIIGSMRHKDDEPRE